MSRVLAAAAALGCFAAMFVAPAGPASTAGAQPAPPIELDGSYSWWTHPIASKVGDTTWIGLVERDGDWVVYKRTDGAELERAEIAEGFETDDHNAPSVLAAPGRPVLAFFTRHDKSTAIGAVRAPEGTLDFGAPTQIVFPKSVTYSQVLQATGDRLILLTRSGSCAWYAAVSDDYGLTWATPKPLVSGCAAGLGTLYVLAARSDSDPNVVHLAAVAHSNESTIAHRRIVHGTLDLTSGVVRDHDSVVANLYTGSGLPVTTDELDEVVRVQTSDRKIRLLDVADKHGTPVVAYVTWSPVRRPKGPTYKLAFRDDSGVWRRTPVAIYSGPPFWRPSTYVGGMTFDRNGGNELYVSTATRLGTSKITRYTLDSTMALTAPVTIVSDDQPVVRPYSPAGSDELLYLSIVSYKQYYQYTVAPLFAPG